MRSALQPIATQLRILQLIGDLELPPYLDSVISAFS